MITQRMILDAVNLQLVSLGHGWAVHRDALPEQFERPCYFISAEKQSRKPIMINSDEVNQQINILCIGTLNDDNRGNADELTGMCDEVIALFTNNGFVRVDDRCLGIAGMAAERTAEDGFKIKMDLSFFDDARLDNEELPTMQEIEFENKIEKE